MHDIDTLEQTSPVIEEVSAAETAYRWLRNQILDTELPSGAMVSEGSVAAELGMSRTPVREALLRLQTEGWVRLYPKRGALVLDAGPHESEHIVQARVLVETDAVRRLAGSPQDAAVLAKGLQQCLADQRAALEASDLGAFTLADADFHAQIVRSGGNELLIGFYSSLRDRQRRMTARSMRINSLRMESVLEDHQQLISLVEAGDADAFERALNSHIRHTNQELLS